MNARIIAVANQKGGIGKTRVVVNLAGCLGQEDCKVLVADMDGRANATIFFGINEEKIEKSIVDVLYPTTDKGGKSISPKYLVIKGSREN